MEVYTLSFITSGNKLYQVDFDLYFLHATKVHVRGPFELDLHGVAKSLDLPPLGDRNSQNEHEYVIGTTVANLLSNSS